MNLPNKLTLARIAMTVLMVVFLLLPGPVWAWLAAVMFVAASLTDMADGRIARSRHLITNFGKFMDPLADKVLVVTAMICFCARGRMPDWAVVIVILREFAVSGLRLIAVERSRVIAAAWSGKIKTACTMVGLCAMLLFPQFRLVNIISTAVILLTTVYSGIEYFYVNRHVFKDLD